MTKLFLALFLVLATPVVDYPYLNVVQQEVVFASHDSFTKHSRKKVTLLDSVTTTGNGSWVRVEGLAKMSVHITGITDATVITNISNTPTQPAAATHHIQLDSTTSDKMIFLDGPVSWIKVRVSVYTGGTISAYLEAHE